MWLRVLVFTLLAAVGPSVLGAPKPLRCRGTPPPGDQRDLRARVEQSPFFLFAAKTFGPPTACTIRWSKAGDGLDATLDYTFPRGATFRVKQLPPETSITTLHAVKAFPDPQAARAFVEAEAKRVGIRPDWTKAEEHAERDGAIRRTYWDPDPGLNSAVDIVYRGDALVELGIHMAL